MAKAPGPLSGVKIVEFAGIGPGPFCGMLLADMGADIIRIDRAGGGMAQVKRADGRGRKSVLVNLKDPAATELCLKLMEKAEITFEGFRPGVMERLGLGPDVVLKRNPKIVYGRMTGWGQTGPYAMGAGHDMNYVAISGALAAIGTRDKPVPPLNLVGDYGGGAMFLAVGILAALLHARVTGQGQVIDAAMSDGAAYLSALFHEMRSKGEWSDKRQDNMLDGGAPYYDTYLCSDGKWISVASMEPQFYALLIEKTGFPKSEAEPQWDKKHWPERKAKFEKIFASKTQAEWCALMEATDVCFAPVLSFDEALEHPHNIAREVFKKVDGIVNVTPTPRFSATPGALPGPAPDPGAHNKSALKAWGFGDSEVEALARDGTI